MTIAWNDKEREIDEGQHLAILQEGRQRVAMVVVEADHPADGDEVEKMRAGEFGVEREEREQGEKQRAGKLAEAPGPNGLFINENPAAQGQPKS